MQTKIWMGLLCACQVFTAQAQTGRSNQDLDVLQDVAEQFLQTQSAQLPGKVSLQVNRLDKRLNLAACASPQAFLPPGNKAWGKTVLGLRCSNPNWTVFVQAQVKVEGEYVAAAVALAPGQVVQHAQLMLLQGDLTTLPANILTDINQVLGQTTAQAISPGTPLRADSLRKANLISQGQLVKLVSAGPGFQVSTEAKAMANASLGQSVAVKTASGQQLNGIAQAGGIVQVSY